MLSVGEGADLKIGTPYKSAKVEAKVLDEGKSKRLKLSNSKEERITKETLHTALFTG